MDAATASKLVSTFGAIVENNTRPSRTQVADVSELPFAKELIKVAFQTEYLNSHDAQYREMLSAVYMYLADYQLGVGPRRVGPDMSRMAEKQKNASTPEQINALVKLMATEFSAQYAEYERWAPVILADRNLLMAEMARLRREVASRK